MNDPLLAHLGSTTLADLWADDTAQDTFTRLGYTIVWSSPSTFFGNPDTAPHDAEDLLLRDPDGQWVALRVGRRNDDGPDLYWEFTGDRATLLYDAFTNAYAGPADSLFELVADLTSHTTPRDYFPVDRDWGAGTTILAAMDLLDPDARDAAVMMQALSAPKLADSLVSHHNWAINRVRPDWDNEAGFELAQAAFHLWPTLFSGSTIPDRRMTVDLLIHPREQWREHASRLTRAAAFRKYSGVYTALEQAWVAKGKSQFSFCVEEVDRMTRDPMPTAS